MYRHCIYCSAELGANEALASFPIGRTLAFDAAKGRLWAVCWKCGRWNLSPIEERWEAIEDAERAFRDTRLRAQSENVGLAKLGDGTRLIRVGKALQGEFAAWRYGEQLVRRSVRYFTHATIAGVAAVAGAMAIATTAAPLIAGGAAIAGQMGVQLVFGYRKLHRSRIPLHALAADETPDGHPRLLRRRELEDAVLRSIGGAEIELHVPRPRELRGRFARRIDPPLVLGDRTARRVLERGMVYINEAGADRVTLAGALRRISDAGSAEKYIQTAGSGIVLVDRKGRAVTEDSALALEMALHEEQERRAMEGELAVLEAAWRDAEPIADLADRLALEP